MFTDERHILISIKKTGDQKEEKKAHKNENSFLWVKKGKKNKKNTSVKPINWGVIAEKKDPKTFLMCCGSWPYISVNTFFYTFCYHYAIIPLSLYFIL